MGNIIENTQLRKNVDQSSTIYGISARTLLQGRELAAITLTPCQKKLRSRRLGLLTLAKIAAESSSVAIRAAREICFFIIFIEMFPNKNNILYDKLHSQL